MGDVECAQQGLSTSASAPSSYVEDIMMPCLPELVMELTFDYLKNDAGSLVNCARAFLTWDRILKKKKTDFMIPLVLPLITTQLSYQDLQQCRLVSRQWKNAVDGLNQQVPEWDLNFKDESCYTSNRIKRLPFCGWSKFGLTGKSKEFMTSLGPTSTNPFPTKIVRFDSMSPAGINADPSIVNVNEIIGTRRNRVTQRLAQSIEEDAHFHDMLKAFGCHIWHLIYRIIGPTPLSHLVCEDAHVNNLSVAYLVKMLKTVPHIRSFTLKNFYDGRIGSWSSPAPQLRHLVALTLMLHYDQHDIQRFLLTAYCGQLEQLECYTSLLLTSFERSPLVFPKMITLKMLGSHWIVSYKTYEHHRLNQLRYTIVAPRLRRLSLQLLYLNCEATMLSNLMEGMSNFSSSLEELYVDIFKDDRFPAKISPEQIHEDEERQRSHPPAAHFPRLRTFHIHSSLASSPNLVSLLGKFPILEELEFIVKDEITDTLTGMDVTHLWTAAPTLRKISIGKSMQWTRSNSTF